MNNQLTRREAREELFKLAFELDFQRDVSPKELFDNAVADRELPKSNYLKNGYEGICEHITEIDEAIGKHSNGWKTERMTPVSRAALRVGTYELLYCEDIPYNVTINECIELVKKYDDAKARAFVNGVLNAVKDSAEEKTEDTSKDVKPEDTAKEEKTDNV